MKIFYLISLLLATSSVSAQNFNGQWKGTFNETSFGFSSLDDHVDYVLELQTNGSNVSGYSYTYFNEGSKRFYTICKLTGTVNYTTKDIVVTEIERVKFNTPPDFQNCFQVHRLHYSQDSGDVETLHGSWTGAPNQTGNCGSGTTVLSRRIVKKIALGHKPPEKKPVEKKKTTIPKKDIVLAPKHNVPKPYQKPAEQVKPKEQQATPPVVKKEDNIKDVPSQVPDIKKSETITEKPSGFEERRTDILKTIVITQPTFKVDFYDNGVVDGDSITVFYNGKIVLSHKMLSTKAISLTLALNENVKENIITMYADNLGSIPPNTALMIVTDGDKRYEVRISSDTEKSGSVIFVKSDK
ncbi:MAG: hypothetical protein M3R50_06510 [Bacteroidota bacterium]|nr:hypothetical protein [Bacteroidota bacterium]